MGRICVVTGPASGIGQVVFADGGCEVQPGKDRTA